MRADNPVTCLKVQNARLRLHDHAAWYVTGQEWEPDISPNAFDGLVTSRTNATRFDFHEYAARRFGCGATHLLGTQAIRSVHNGGEDLGNDLSQFRTSLQYCLGRAPAFEHACADD